MIKKVIKKSENKNHNHNQKNITELKPDGNWNKPPISNSSQHYKTHHHHQQHHQKQQSSSQQQQQQQQQQNPSQNYHNFNNNQNHQHQQHHQQQLLKSRVRDSLSSERSSSCPNSSTTNSDGNNSGIVDFGNIDDDDDSDSTLSTDSSEYNIDDDDDDDSDTSNNTNNEHHDNGEKETLDPISEEISSMKKKSSDNNNDDDDDENGDGTSESSLSLNSGGTGDGASTLQNDSRWCTSDEDSSFYKERTSTCKYDSTCCDEDFTWVCSETSVEPSQQKKPSLSSNSPTAIINNNNNNTISTLNTIGKPPQRPLGSLDRKRHQNHANRRDRDQKSKSAHSLRDKNILNDTKDSYNHRLIIPKHQQHKEHDNNNFYNESSSSYTNLRCKRGSPTAYWEPPPPPPLPYPGYDFHPYWGGYSSREDLRMQQQQHHDYYNNKRHEFCHYGSTNTLPVLSSSQEFFSNSPCCGGVGGGCRYPPNYCLCNHKNSSMWNLNQRPDVDERLRRYQTEKESLIVQVQVLTDQLSAQNTKIIELEKSLTEKTQLLNSTEDMLQREMLSRSSLETQKLELMSAMSELKLQQAALERENLELRASQSNNNSLSRRLPIVNSQRFLSSTPQQQHQQQDITVNNTSFHGSIGSLQPQINLSTPNAPKTPPASFRHQVNPHFSSLPRTSFSSTFSTTTQQKQHKSNENGLENSINLVDNNANLKQRNVAFAENEKVIDEFNTLELQRNHTPQQSGTSPSLSQKSKGLRSIFGKIKRSNSGNLEDLPGDGEFKRGGIRATAGARLGWSQNLKPNKPFKEWNIDEICAWFDEMGLGCYEDDLKKWITNGSDLIDASPIDIERELNLKSQLHRKKIILAIRELSEKETDEMTLNAGKLDTSWVMRWLDDIGLPQHKDAFSITRLDGRMLHKLTMDDLTSLHITSCLHVASLRRGIQIMRENNWNPDCLIRRSSSENSENEQVALWTAHRVMEWLRVVDLAEYAPNLRGAGVHGALMIYETRFTADLLADLLSIPPSKTLLRRHLATHFKELLGRDVIQGKRDAENTLGYQPLTITSKIKTPKKSQFSLKRRKSTKGGDEWSDFVCPMGPSDDEATESRHHNRLRTCLSSN